LNIILTTLNARYAHSSIGLRYIYANLNEFQKSTTLLEFNINDALQTVAEKILHHNPNIIGIGVYIWNAKEVQELLHIIKKISPNTLIVLGGPEVSYQLLRINFDQADFIVQGEGEISFYELCKSIYKLRPASQVIFEKYIQEIEFVNQDDFAVYMSYFPSPFPEKSLSKIYPEVASQWDYEKNYPLTPDNFTHGSKHKVWWICENGHSHQTSINSKTWHRNGKYKGCKYCSEMRLAPSDKIQTDLFSSQEKDS